VTIYSSETLVSMYMVSYYHRTVILGSIYKVPVFQIRFLQPRIHTVLPLQNQQINRKQSLFHSENQTKDLRKWHNNSVLLGFDYCGYTSDRVVLKVRPQPIPITSHTVIFPRETESKPSRTHEVLAQSS
jgi:hypothetical protein